MHRGLRPRLQAECEWKQDSSFIVCGPEASHGTGKLPTIRPGSDERVPAHSCPGPRIMDNFPQVTPDPTTPIAKLKFFR